jgi:hypothetical protein
MAGVKQAREGAVGVLTLDEPASLNAMTPDLLGGFARDRRDDGRCRRAGAGADRGGRRVFGEKKPALTRSRRDRAA